MSELDDDIRRGCLKNGESIEAKWGSGWWSEQRTPPEIDYTPFDYTCPKCGSDHLFVVDDGPYVCADCGYVEGELVEEAPHVPQ